MRKRTGQFSDWMIVLGTWEARLLEWFHQHQDRLLLLALLGIALALRLQLASFASPDFLRLQGWLDAALPFAPGGEELRGEELLDIFRVYPAAYLSWMGLLDRLLRLALDLEAARLLPAKLIPVIFEVICAIYLYRLVRLRYPLGPAAMYAVVGLGFAPSVVMSGAFLGRPDVLPVTGLMACVYYLSTGRAGRAWVAFSLAVALQPQALFLAPLLVVLLQRKRPDGQVHLPLKGLLLVPVVYLAGLLLFWWSAGGQAALWRLAAYPFAWLAGIPYPTVSIYAWAPPEIPGVFYLFGLLVGLAALFLLSLAALESTTRLGPERMLLLAVISLLTGMFLFPGTQAGSFLAVDVLSIVLAFYFPRLFYVPFVMAFISTHARLAELFNLEIIPLLYLSFVPLGLIVLLARRWADQLEPDTLGQAQKEAE